MHYESEEMRKVVAAGGASVLSVLVTTPLDVVKNRMQAQAAVVGLARRSVPEAVVGRLAIAGCPSVCPRLGNPSLPPVCAPECFVYDSTLDAIRKIARQEGMNTLWRGTRAGLMIAIPMVGIYLPLYEALVNQFSSTGLYAPVLAGSTARTISMFFVAPLDILRLRMQVATSAMKTSNFSRAGGDGNAHDRMSDWRKFDWGQGKGMLGRARAMWRGYGASVARDVPFSGLYWGLLEPMRKYMLEMHPSPQLSEVLAANTIAGATAGVLAAGITTPLDVVKTRQQIISQGHKSPTPVHRLLFDIAKNEGITGLFSGAGPRCLRAAPSCAIVLSTYEILKRIL